MGPLVSASMAQPVTRIPPATSTAESTLPETLCRHGRSWVAVTLSTRTVPVQVPSISQGAMQVTSRQTIGPRQAIPWLHWPYRKLVQPALRLLQSPLAQPQLVPEHEPLHTPFPPHPQPLQGALQSM